jgi:hypothetical protein
VHLGLAVGLRAHARPAVARAGHLRAHVISARRGEGMVSALGARERGRAYGVVRMEG